MLVRLWDQVRPELVLGEGPGQRGLGQLRAAAELDGPSEGVEPLCRQLAQALGVEPWGPGLGRADLQGRLALAGGSLELDAQQLAASLAPGRERDLDRGLGEVEAQGERLVAAGQAQLAAAEAGNELREQLDRGGPPAVTARA